MQLLLAEAVEVAEVQEPLIVLLMAIGMLEQALQVLVDLVEELQWVGHQLYHL
jgi:hypothetical protein